MTTNTNTPTRNNRTLWLLLALFVIPVVIAYLYFFFGPKPDTNNYGKLIVPVIDIETFKLADKSGALLSREALTPMWRMYYFAGASCNKDCQLSLYNMRQINIALGKNADRVQHVIVHLNQPDNEFVKLAEAEHTAAINMFSQPEYISTLLKLENNTAETQSIYLVDPQGNVMMKFTKELTPKLILKDLNKLLKISQVG